MTKRTAERAIADDLKAAEEAVTKAEAKYEAASTKVKAALDERRVVDEARQTAIARRDRLARASAELAAQTTLEDAIAAVPGDAPPEDPPATADVEPTPITSAKGAAKA